MVNSFDVEKAGTVEEGFESEDRRCANGLKPRHGPRGGVHGVIELMSQRWDIRLSKIRRNNVLSFNVVEERLGGMLQVF